VTEFQGASYHGGGRGGVIPVVAAAGMSQRAIVDRLER